MVSDLTNIYTKIHFYIIVNLYWIRVWIHCIQWKNAAGLSTCPCRLTSDTCCHNQQLFLITPPEQFVFMSKTLKVGVSNQVSVILIRIGVISPIRYWPHNSWLYATMVLVYRMGRPKKNYSFLCQCVRCFWCLDRLSKFELNDFTTLNILLKLLNSKEVLLYELVY